jgi:hypothetical protein
MTALPVRIAMWSGPRNISTAMLRSWGNRPDTAVYDEPFYAYYLKATGLDHPGAAEIVASYPTDWRTVVAEITGPVPDGRAIWYQKHMTHHMLDEIDYGWLDQVANCFLIRSPRAMLTSYIKVRPDVTMDELGLRHQRRIFDLVHARTGSYPPVIDSRDVLQDPRRTLTLLCEAVGVPFTETMLHWPAGPRASDGLWSRYWYDRVEQSTSFEPYRPKDDPVPPRYQAMLEECDSLYEEMYQHRLR